MKPVIKYPGGKTWALKYLKEIITPELLNGHTYYEPFVGGGALAFELKHSDTVINDLNSELINMYRIIRDYPEQLISILKQLWVNHSETQFYQIRAYDRDSAAFDKIDPILKAARTIYLNKFGFNGLYRVNSKGFFNVPLGRTASGKLPELPESEIRQLSIFLKNTQIREGDYSKAITDAKSGDVIYLDSPYNYETEGFTAYQKEGWTNENLIELKHICDTLVDKGVRTVISNNSIPFVLDLFNDTRYSYIEIDAKRSINSDKNGRGPVKEIIIFSKNCK